MLYCILAISLITLAIHLYYIKIFHQGLKNHTIGKNKLKKTVSVVIAARNEEKNISKLLSGLEKQTYPQNLFEVIVANDQSTDNTTKIVQEFMVKNLNIKLVNVKNRDQAISPKKNALTQGIEASEGEIIVSTDADCIVQPKWLESIIAEYDENISMVVGFAYTSIDDWKNASLAQKFEYFDLSVLFITAAGAICSEKYFSCSGANMSYTRKAYDKIGGFEKIKHLISGDDVNFLQLMRKANQKVKFMFQPSSFTITHPVKNWQNLINQRTRWSSNSKWQLLLNPEFFLYLLTIFLLIASTLILLFFKWWIGLLILAIKFIPEFKLIKLGFQKFALPQKRLRFFPAWFLIQPFYIILVAIMGIFNAFNWHGRR